jgi:hypothetical protein
MILAEDVAIKIGIGLLKMSSRKALVLLLRSIVRKLLSRKRQVGGRKLSLLGESWSVREKRRD